MTQETASLPGEKSSYLAKWQETLQSAGAEHGFYEELGDHHRALFMQKSDTIVVTFDNLDDVRQDADRLPWGVNFINSCGWSSLGVMAHGPTWYRDQKVIEFFDRLDRERFFERFARVVFYGTSMGGYAAAAYSAACPGARVIAVNPQATLERDRAGWETRFRPAWRYDYSGPYGYAPEMLRSASKAYIFYNPTITHDSMHAALFQGHNIVKIRCAHMGHGMLSVWRQMGVLRKIIAGCVEDDISTTEIHRLLRARHNSPAWQKLMLQHLQRHRRHRLVLQFCDALRARGNTMQELDQARTAALVAIG